MGRLKGGTNKKHKKPILNKVYKKRGRPKKEIKVIEDKTVGENVKRAKFLGYCPKCNLLACKKDCVSKFIFECPLCNKRCRISQLKQAIKKEGETNKKDYMETSLNVSNYDLPPLNDVIINERELKIQEI